MTAFIVLPIPAAVTAEVRASRRAPGFGHPVHHERASGTGPCRACLRPFEVGAEDRLLFTYNPTSAADALPQPGPVFVHADACTPHAGVGYPAGLRSLPVVAVAHRADGTIEAPRALPHGAEETILEELLERPDVARVHLRHAEAGCFIARVEPAGV